MQKFILELQNFPWFDYKRYSFSLGLAVGENCYLSGHTASTYDPERKQMVVEGGMAPQARTAYVKAAAILEAGGKTFADVVRVVEYVTPQGIERYAEAEAVRNEIFGSHHPAVNTVPVKALLRPDAFIEVEVMTGPAGTATPAAVNGAVVHETGDLIILPSISAGDRFMVTATAGTISQTAVGAQSLAKWPKVKGSSSEGPERRAAISAGGGMALVVAARRSRTTPVTCFTVTVQKFGSEFLSIASNETN